MLKKLFFSVISVLLLTTTNAYAENLNIYNWSDYIAENTLDDFEKETGIKTVYDVYDSNDVLEAKLLAGSTGYDIVVPTLSYMINQINSDVYQKIDKSKLSNYGNLDPKILKRLHDAGDANNQYAVPYLWGTNGIGYNVKKIKERLPNAPLNSWDLLFKPEIISKFKDCGVSILDAQNEVVPIVLNYLGFSPNSDNPDQLAQAEDLLSSIRPYVKYYHSSSYIDDLANGEICLALGWSGDVYLASDDAAEGVEIEYVIPKEGTIIWFDVFGIPKDAKNVDQAHKFIDFVLREQVIGDITNYVSYANPNPGSLQYVDDEIKNNLAIYPDEATYNRLFTTPPDTKKRARARNKVWSRMKAQ